MSAESRYQIDPGSIPGTARVFAGVRRMDGKPVFVKRLRRGETSARETAALRHEYAILQRLTEAPVAHALDFTSELDSVGLVLERAPGRALRAIIDDGLPDPERFVKIAAAVARTLAEVHQRGIVHRDIKPEHVFIDDQNGQATLIDFGLATAVLRDRHEPVESDRLEGTLVYMSPEQTGRTSRPVDRRSDLYSLGVTLYEFCVGKPPFESHDPLELVHAHLAKTPAPLRACRRELPERIEAIVMRLLAKAPDARYQTAAGLATDLERCQRELATSGSIAPFELGQADHDGELRVPETIYGRSTELNALVQTIGRCQQGARELALICGPPGIGKSALVQELHHEFASEGHFVSGRFNPYAHDIPYSALASACHELVSTLLASPDAKLEAWKMRLKALLGENAGVVLDLVPSLALVMGPQPPVPALPPHEAKLRFEHFFRRFMQASACAGMPLVIFIDDLQWADPASLAAIELILAAEEQTHLLVIASYRDAEVAPAHPLTSWLARLEQKLPVARFGLSLLRPEDVLALVEDALPLRSQDPQPLARVIHEKTSGNPFFVGQFLELLAGEGHLRYEPGLGFTWDLKAIEALPATDNVGEIVARRLAALDPRARDLLRLAACIGYTFGLKLLSQLAAQPVAEVAQALALAVDGGFLVPLDRDHRILADWLAAEKDATIDLTYRFFHGRVQQAVLAGLAPSESASIHLRIGRLQLSTLDEREANDEQLFGIVTQLNLGRSLVRDQEEGRRVALLNLAAARRAKSSNAHETVLALSSVCLELLGSEPFAADYGASLDAHLLLIEAHCLGNEAQRAFDLIEVVERQAKDVLDRVPVRNLKTNLLIKQGRFEAANDVSLETLALLGLNLPDPRDQAALGQAIGESFAAYQGALGARAVASLQELPAMLDPRRLAMMDTMAGMIPASFQCNENLMVLTVLTAVRLQLEHGTAPMSPFFYALYGVTHNVVTSDYQRAHQFGLLAIELARRPQHAIARAAAEFIYGAFLSAWVNPAMESNVHFEQTVSAGLANGDQLYVAYGVGMGLAHKFHAGEDLAEIAALLPGAQKTLASCGDVINRQFLTVLERSWACLRGQSAGPGSMDGENFSEAKFVEQAPLTVKGPYGACKAMLCYLFDDAKGACRAAEDYVPIPGNLYGADYFFFHGMACAELARLADPSDRPALLARAEPDLKRFAILARSCPHNFAARDCLLRAEVHASQGEEEAALGAYQTALVRASDATSALDLALAHERLGRFCARSGRRRLGNLEIAEACEQYERWGALGKVARLRQEFPEVVAATVNAGEGDTRSNTIRWNASCSISGEGGQLDLTSAMRAAQAIASELHFAPLLSRLIRLLVENAGATRGLLLLSEGGALKLRAELRIDPEMARVDLDEPIETSTRLPASVVQYCARALDSVAIQDLSRDRRFLQDPYLRKHACKSVACFPLLFQGTLAGLLYLEHDRATGAFHAARVDRLKFLAGHAAVAIQNARLYDQVESANATLEQRVRERTLELSGRNRDMHLVLDNVTQGLVTIDRAGRLCLERSRVVDQWFGAFDAPMAFRDYLARVDPSFAENFAVGFQLLLDDVLPEELAISQLPSALQHEGRHFKLSYQPIHSEGELTGLLVVIDDMTESVRRARDEAEQKEELVLSRRLSSDRSGLLGFFEEAEVLVKRLLDPDQPQDDLRRGLHTLKGNAAMFGLSLLAERCHEVEDSLAQGCFEARQMEMVGARFAALRSTLVALAGERASEQVQIPRETLRGLARRIQAGMPANEACEAIETLMLDPISLPLGRLADYARALCARLGKGELAVIIDDSGLLVDGPSCAPVFAVMVHLVRNAVDHGLEGPDERLACGKGAQTLFLSAVVCGHEIDIGVRDNGRGIDWDRVRAVAESRALPSASREALEDVLFAPEFSTRSEVTATSGRGMGLAAVRTTVERMGGKIRVESTRGQGSVFTVRLPCAPLRVTSRVNGQR